MNTENPTAQEQILADLLVAIEECSSWPHSAKSFAELHTTEDILQMTLGDMVPDSLERIEVFMHLEHTDDTIYTDAEITQLTDIQSAVRLIGKHRGANI